MYVGVDLHRKRSHVVALDAAGAVMLSRRIGNTPAEFLRSFGELRDRAAHRRCGDVKGLPGRTACGLGPHGYLDQGPATNGSTSHEPTDR